MNTPGTNRDTRPAFIQCTACQGAIRVKDGMYHVDERKYHPDCYDRLLEGLLPLRGRALALSPLGSACGSAFRSLDDLIRGRRATSRRGVRWHGLAPQS